MFHHRTYIEENLTKTINLHFILNTLFVNSLLATKSQSLIHADLQAARRAARQFNPCLPKNTSQRDTQRDTSKIN